MKRELDTAWPRRVIAGGRVWVWDPSRHAYCWHVEDAGYMWASGAVVLRRMYGVVLALPAEVLDP